MAAWRYEISLLVLKKIYFTSERSERVKYFSTLEEKFRISARPCNILYFPRFLTSLKNNKKYKGMDFLLSFSVLHFSFINGQSQASQK